MFWGFRLCCCFSVCSVPASSRLQKYPIKLLLGTHVVGRCVQSACQTAWEHTCCRTKEDGAGMSQAFCRQMNRAGKTGRDKRAQRKRGKCKSVRPSAPQSSEVNFLIVSWKVFTKQQHWTEVLKPERLNYSKIYRKGPAGCERAKYMKDGKANFRRCYCCLCKVLALVYSCPSEDSGLFNTSFSRKICHWFFHHREYVQSTPSGQMYSRFHF